MDVMTELKRLFGFVFLTFTVSIGLSIPAYFVGGLLLEHLHSNLVIHTLVGLGLLSAVMIVYGCVHNSFND